MALSGGHFADRDRLHSGADLGGGRLDKELGHRYRSIRGYGGAAGQRSGDPKRDRGQDHRRGLHAPGRRGDHQPGGGCARRTRVASADRNSTPRTFAATVERRAELRARPGWGGGGQRRVRQCLVTANRAAHQALVAALTGETREGVTIENDTVSINLGPIIQEVKQRLIDRGFELASRIPNVNPSFVLVQSDYIAQARGAFNLLNAIGNWLPVIALFFLAIGIYVAKGHRRALVGVGLGLAGGMLALGLALALFRTIYLNELPLGVLTRDAAAAFYDTLVRFLRLGLRMVLVLGLVIALAGFLTGRSVTAVRARAGLTKGIGWLRGGAEQAGFRTGPVGAWVYTYKKVLWVAVIAIAALVLVFWDQPTGRVVLGITLGVLVALVIIEFLGRPPSPAAPELSEPESPEIPEPESPAGVDLDDASPDCLGHQLTDSRRSGSRCAWLRCLTTEANALPGGIAGS